MKIKDSLLDLTDVKEYEKTPPTHAVVSSTGGGFTTTVGGFDPHTGTIDLSGIATTAPLSSGGGTYFTPYTAPYTTPSTPIDEVESADDVIKLLDKAKLDAYEDIMDDLEACETTDDLVSVMAKLQKKIKRLKKDNS